MFGFLILGLIIFAIVQRHRYRRLDRMHGCSGRWSRKWERWQPDSDSPHWNADKWHKWDRQWGEWEHWSQEARNQAADIEEKIAQKIARAEAKIRREAEKLRRYSNASNGRETSPEPAPEPAAAKPAESDATSTAKAERFATEEERKAYQRARKRAAAEAGFYVHLMWYGIVIGSCLLVNLVTTPGFEWWVFPALGWGIGLVSHFGAVYGWRWIHERVFEPAIKREVQREVTIEKEVMRTEKQASLDELTATFAHEIRNPIAAAKSLVQQMGEDPTSSENVEYARVALDELARVERSVSHLLKYAKEEDYSFDNVNLAAVVDAAITQMRSKLEAKNVTVSRNYIGGPTVRADADKLRQVFTNVIDNAIDAMESNAGERRLEIGIRTLRPAAATVMIRDNGCGIGEDELGKIFNPFYTSKPNGTGLGMGVAKKVMDAHNGRIEVHSQSGAGTEFLISLPISDALRPGVAAEAQPGAQSEFERAPETAQPNSNSADAPATGNNGQAHPELRLGPGGGQ
ncbi:MAG TPA: ATP-binding protein [Candidatus Binataceae bacterium]|nr:ATP-binding protein [Candidatus Binataceae bacterium]